MTRTLTISRLTKRFQSVEALKAVSLTLEAGRRAALLGHNGAGKSTMMKIILGLIPFDGGEVSVCGAAPGSAAARSQLAYLPENVAFHPALTGEEQLRHYLALRGENPRQAMELLARVGQEAGQEHVRRLGQLVQDLAAAFRREIDPEAALAPVRLLPHEVEADRRQQARGDEAALRIARHRVLDLDHVGAPVGEHAARRRHEPPLRDLENTHAFERFHHDQAPQRFQWVIDAAGWTRQRKPARRARTHQSTSSQ